MVFRRTDKSKISDTILWAINIMFIMLFFIWIIFNWDKQDVIYEFNSILFPWVCILIVVQMISFKIKNVPFYDFGLWFVSTSYLFMFGYLFRDAFRMDTGLIWNPIVNFTNVELFHTYIFVIISLEMFSIGYLMFYRKSNVIKKSDFRKIIPDKRMYITGIILISIGGLSKLINDFRIISVTQSANSYSAFSDSVGSGIVDDLAYLLLPGLFFLFFSGCIKERTKKIIFILMLLYFVSMMMLTGSRKIQIFSILSLFLGFEFSLDKVNFSIRRTSLYTFLGILVLNILIIIRDNRFDLVSIGPELITKITSFNLLENIVGEILAETGLTVLSVVSIIKVVPNLMPFQYGMTYIRTIPSVLPIGWLLGDFFNLASSTYVINSYTKLPVGSSFIGDLYWNWGYIGGAFAAFLSGILISKFMYVSRKNNIRKNSALYFSVFSQLIILVRSELFDVFRPITMLILVVFFVDKFMNNFWRVKND